MKLVDALHEAGWGTHIAAYSPALARTLEERGFKRPLPCALVVGHLIHRARRLDGWVERSCRQIKGATGISLHDVREAIKELEKARILEADRTSKTTRFRIHLGTPDRADASRDDRADASRDPDDDRADASRDDRADASRDDRADASRDDRADASRDKAVSAVKAAAARAAAAESTFDRQSVILHLASSGIEPGCAAVAIARIERYAAAGRVPKTSWQRWAEGIARKLTPDEVEDALGESERAVQAKSEREGIDACDQCNESGLRWNFELDEIERCRHEPVGAPA